MRLKFKNFYSPPKRGRGVRRRKWSWGRGGLKEEMWDEVQEKELEKQVEEEEDMVEEKEVVEEETEDVLELFIDRL